MVHLDELGLLDLLDHQLGDPVTPPDFVVSARICVDEEDAQLVAVPRVDESRGVEAGDAVTKCEPAPGLDEPGISGRYGQSDPRRDQSATAARREGRILPGIEVSSGVAFVRIGRTRQIWVYTDNGNLEH
jgi:hypothetical protein